MGKIQRLIFLCRFLELHQLGFQTSPTIFYFVTTDLFHASYLPPRQLFVIGNNHIMCHYSHYSTRNGSNITISIFYSRNFIYFSTGNGTTQPTVITALHVTTITTTEPVPDSAEEEHEKSMEIFFILLVVGKYPFLFYHCLLF